MSVPFFLPRPVSLRTKRSQRQHIDGGRLAGTDTVPSENEIKITFPNKQIYLNEEGEYELLDIEMLPTPPAGARGAQARTAIGQFLNCACTSHSCTLKMRIVRYSSRLPEPLHRDWCNQRTPQLRWTSLIPGLSRT